MVKLGSVGGLPVKFTLSLLCFDTTQSVCLLYMQVVMKELLAHGLLHGDCLTVTGRTLSENLETVPSLSDLGEQVNP